jgi:hypothetical protein
LVSLPSMLILPWLYELSLSFSAKSNNCFHVFLREYRKWDGGNFPSSH